MALSTDFWIGLAIGLIGILVTLGVAWYQRQIPNIFLDFSIPDGSPARLICRIRNAGRGEARDVVVGFAFGLPVETRIFASPEIRAEIQEADYPPDPTAGPATATLQRALSVRVPRVAAGDTAEFELRTVDPDNERAAAQVLRIRSVIASIVSGFGKRLRENHVVLGRNWDDDLILSARVKQDCFFRPSVLSYERGRQRVSILSEEEELAAARGQDLHARFKAEYVDIFQGRPDFIAPVIKVKTAEGIRTYASFPPYVNSRIEMTVLRSELQPGRPLLLYPPVPESYD